MNVLSVKEKVGVISLLMEGNSIRNIERTANIHHDTIICSISEIVGLLERQNEEKAA